EQALHGQQQQKQRQSVLEQAIHQRLRGLISHNSLLQRHPMSGSSYVGRAASSSRSASSAAAGQIVKNAAAPSGLAQAASNSTAFAWSASASSVRPRRKFASARSPYPP